MPPIAHCGTACQWFGVHALHHSAFWGKIVVYVGTAAHNSTVIDGLGWAFKQAFILYIFYPTKVKDVLIKKFAI
jgi:hypothetical protein